MSTSLTLLIVDDCAVDRKIYRRYLSKDPHQSYQILEATCAADGLALHQQTPSQAILLDYRLPDMSGLEFLDQLQQLETDVPVIMLTGQGDEAIAVQAMKRGVQDYLSKQHLKPDVLQLAVRNVIKQSHLQGLLHKTQERQRLIALTALRLRQSLNVTDILQTTVAEVQQLLQCDYVAVYQGPAAGKPATGHPPPESLWAQPDCFAAQSTAPKDLSYPWPQIVETGWHSYQQLLPLPTPTTPPGTNLSPLVPLLALSLHPADRCLTGENDRPLGQAWVFVGGRLEQAQENLVAPILLYAPGQAHLWGLLVAHQASPVRYWQVDDIEMFYELSVQLAIAIQQAELLTQTQTALNREKELNAFKSQIIGTIAHEYRTPLTSILAAASTLKLYSHKLQAHQQQRCLEIIEERTRHMTKLVDDMLIAQQFEHNQLQFKPLPFDLLQFFVDLIDEQRQTTADRHSLTLQISGNPSGFWGDRGLLRQVITNLLTNAIKYSPEGGSIEVHLSGNPTSISFSVKDQGIGIPVADQTKLFQAFNRGTNVETIPGTGLGLAIVKACVDLHGGQITLESQKDQGTMVTVTLPKRSAGEGIKE